VDSVESAIASEQGGAQRIELCSNLPEGGVTPSAGMIAMTRKRVSIALHVLIRPRAGDFTYSDLEFEVIKRDILLAKQLGANGVALGVLDSEGNIDVVRTRELVSLARPMAATFHRAFDLTRDPLAALEDVISTNADRVLTSGGAETAEKGSANLARLHKAAKGRIQIRPPEISASITSATFSARPGYAKFTPPCTARFPRMVPPRTNRTSARPPRPMIEVGG